MLFRFMKVRWQVAALLAPAALLAAVLAAFPWLSHGHASRSGPDDGVAHERAAERRGVERRRTELTALAALPGSALPCLDALAGEPVESACEEAVFASPMALAAAVSYAAARLRLLADGVAYARRLDPAYEASLADLRAAVENDAYGIYAQVLSRAGCTPERCAAFDLLRDTATLKVHLRQGVYAAYVAQHSRRWGAAGAPTAAGAATVAAPAVEPPLAAAPGWTASIAPPPMPRAAEVTPAAAESPTRVRGVVPPAASILPNIEFPSANSIPPVSIMAAEPKAPAAEAEAAAPASSAAAKSSPRPQ